MISNRPGYLFTSSIKAVTGFLSLSSFPYITSLISHKKPRSCGMREDIYCAISTSIPSGYSSLLYPRQAVWIADLVASVPKVTTCTIPNSPRSSLIFSKIKGRLLGARSISISGNSARSLFKKRQYGNSQRIGSSWVIPNR